MPSQDWSEERRLGKSGLNRKVRPCLQCSEIRVVGARRSGPHRGHKNLELAILIGWI
jgi:hypothetical protein